MAVNGWQYKTIDARSTEVIAFKKETGDYLNAAVKRDYNDVNKFAFNLFSNGPINKPDKFVLKLEKNTQGKIIKKILLQKHSIIWVEEIFYTNNAITGYKRYRFNGGKEALIFEASNQYFSVNDLPKL